MQDSTTNGKEVALSPDEFRPFPLLESKQLSENTKLFRFALPTPTTKLGLPVGNYIAMQFDDLDGKTVTRYYTPTTGNDELGYVDFVIKLDAPNKPNTVQSLGRGMSYHLQNMKIGDNILLQGPHGTFEYKGNGVFHMEGRPDKKVTKIGCVCGGTGITPMLQVINAVINEGSNIELSLIYANQREQDILLRDTIEDIAAQHSNFKFHYTLDYPSSDWKYSSGYITADMLKEHMPAPDPNMLILMCGPKAMIQYACIDNLTGKLGYTNDMLFSFC